MPERDPAADPEQDEHWLNIGAKPPPTPEGDKAAQQN
jgi:hypothetical protein